MNANLKITEVSFPKVILIVLPLDSYAETH